MIQVLTRLLEQIPKLICSNLFQLPDPIAMLELRDGPEFELEWLRVHRLISEHDKLSPHSATVNEIIHAIEEASFKAVYSATGATNFTDFAPLVSDDFSLIARATGHELHDPWLSGLLCSYRRGDFPTGTIPCVDVPIHTLLDMDS